MAEPTGTGTFILTAPESSFAAVRDLAMLNEPSSGEVAPLEVTDAVSFQQHDLRISWASVIFGKSLVE